MSDWEELIRTADRHGVLPLIAFSLGSTCPDAVPQAVMECLQGRLCLNAVRNARLVRELLRLLDRFAAEAIPVLPFKGPALAALAYGNLALRQMVDLDILVHPHDVPRARAVLRATGFRAGHEDIFPLDPHEYHDLFRSEADGTPVELHWRFTAASLGFPLALADVWESLEPVTLAGRSVRTLAVEEALVVHCVHGSRHGWERLGWICDVAELLRAHPVLDWERMLAQSQSVGGRRQLLLGLRLAHDLLEAPLPPTVQALAAADRVGRALAAHVRVSLFDSAANLAGWSRRPSIRLRMLHRAEDRLCYALAYALPKIPPNEKDHALLPLPAPLGFLYYGIRLLRLIWEYGLGRGTRPG